MIQANRYKEKPPRPKSWGLGRPTKSLRCGGGGDEFDVFQKGGSNDRTVRGCEKTDKVRVALVVSVADASVGFAATIRFIREGLTLHFRIEV